MSEYQKIMLVLGLCGLGSILLTMLSIVGMALAFTGNIVVGVTLWAAATWLNTLATVTACGFLWGCIELGADKE